MMKLKSKRRFHYTDEYTEEEGRKVRYKDESKFFLSLDSEEVASSGLFIRWVHLIPMMLILCSVALWRHSDKVGWVLGSKAEVVVKDGRDGPVLHTEIPRQPENGFRTNHAIHALPENATPKSSAFVDGTEGEASTDSTSALRNPTASKPTAVEARPLTSNSTDSEPTEEEAPPMTSNSWSLRG